MISNPEIQVTPPCFPIFTWQSFEQLSDQKKKKKEKKMFINWSPPGKYMIRVCLEFKSFYEDDIQPPNTSAPHNVFQFSHDNHLNNCQITRFSSSFVSITAVNCWNLGILGGYSVQKTLQGYAVNMGSKIRLLVYEWPLIKCKIWYINGLIFQNFLKFEPKLAQISEFFKKIGWFCSMGHFFLKIGICMGLLSNSMVARPYQNQIWITPPPPPQLGIYNQIWFGRDHTTENIENMMLKDMEI